MMFTDIDLLSFLFGTMYGITVLTIMHFWNTLASWEFIKHDNTKGKCGTDTYEIERASWSRCYMIGLASLVWPLTLALVLLYGLFRIPILIYKKTGK